MLSQDNTPQGDFFLSDPAVERVGRSGNYCPHGKIGDRLWVRETFSKSPDGITYRATLEDHGISACDDEERWTPSIHMPRTAYRITLEITDVRVQRIQEISEDDALAEGCLDALDTLYEMEQWCSYSVMVAKQRGLPRPGVATALGAFAFVWDRLNKKRGFGWKESPWVWAISFKRVCSL